MASKQVWVALYKSDGAKDQLLGGEHDTQKAAMAYVDEEFVPRMHPAATHDGWHSKGGDQTLDLGDRGTVTILRRDSEAESTE